MKRILLTGGTGFIGQQLIVPLIQQGDEIHLITSSSSPIIASKKIIIHQFNLLDNAKHAFIMNLIRPSHILHAAWYTKHGKFWQAEENIDWLKTTLSLFKAFCKFGGTRFLGVGTCAEYLWNNTLCSEKEMTGSPASLYGKIKKITYEMLLTLAQTEGIQFAWARIFFTYGPHESKDRLIPYVITNLLNNKVAHCTHGNQMRDFLYVDDIAAALVALLNSNLVGGINIASGIPVKIKDVIKQIGLIMNKKHLIKLDAMNEASPSPSNIVGDVTRLISELKWSPHTTLYKGLVNTIDWWKKNHTLNFG